jgi:hypothetical protein
MYICLVTHSALQSIQLNTMPRTFKTRNIPCSIPGCTKTFSNRGGLKNHLRVHRFPRQRVPPPQSQSPVPGQQFDNDHPSPIQGGSQHESEPKDTTEDVTSHMRGERVQYHPFINGTHFLFLSFLADFFGVYRASL